MNKFDIFRDRNGINIYRRGVLKKIDGLSLTKKSKYVYIIYNGNEYKCPVEQTVSVMRYFRKMEAKNKFNVTRSIKNEEMGIYLSNM